MIPTHLKLSQLMAKYFKHDFKLTLSSLFLLPAPYSMTPMRIQSNKKTESQGTAWWTMMLWQAFLHIRGVLPSQLDSSRDWFWEDMCCGSSGILFGFQAIGNLSKTLPRHCRQCDCPTHSFESKLEGIPPDTSSAHLAGCFAWGSFGGFGALCVYSVLCVSMLCCGHLYVRLCHVVTWVCKHMCVCLCYAVCVCVCVSALCSLCPYCAMCAYVCLCCALGVRALGVLCVCVYVCVCACAILCVYMLS